MLAVFDMHAFHLYSSALGFSFSASSSLLQITSHIISAGVCNFVKWYAYRCKERPVPPSPGHHIALVPDNVPSVSPLITGPASLLTTRGKSPHQLHYSMSSVPIVTIPLSLGQHRAPMDRVVLPARSQQRRAEPLLSSIWSCRRFQY